MFVSLILSVIRRFSEVRKNHNFFLSTFKRNIQVGFWSGFYCLKPNLQITGLSDPDPIKMESYPIKMDQDPNKNGGGSATLPEMISSRRNANHHKEAVHQQSHRGALNKRLGSSVSSITGLELRAWVRSQSRKINILLTPWQY